ncbi:MAG: protease Do [Caulobacteraceae bacterium]|nr:protease Do [Caulobacteraceae bacterium]
MNPRRTPFVLALVVLATTASAQPYPSPSDDVARRPPPDAATMRMSFAPIVRRVAPAVVNVYSRRVVRQQVDPFWSLFSGGYPRDRVEQSLGSGAIVRADGVILTNHHNIANAQEVRVATADRREWPATVILDDARADLAVLKIDAKGERLPTITIDDVTRPQVGDLVLAIGNPFGVGQTVTNGIVSALARSDVGINDYAFFIQTDAAINPGNSGGPLVDMEGKLIGVNTAIVSSSGASAGIGFAIPAVMAKQVVDAALSGDRTVSRPWLGARGQALTDEMARSFGMDRPEGVVVTDVWPGGPAARAGIGRGDVIMAVDGEPVNDDAGLTYRIATSHVGEDVALRVRHAGQVRAVSLRIERPPATPAADQRTLAGRNPLSGATVVNMSPASAQQYGADPFTAQGVLVTQIGGGYAQSIGVQAGDFIREVNGQKIASTADLAAALQTPSHGWTIVIQRAGQIITARFGV